MTNKLVRQLCFYLIFFNSRLNKTKQSSKAFFCKVAGLLHLLYLIMIFNSTKAMHNRSTAFVFMHRVFFFTSFGKAGVTGFYFNHRTNMLVGIKVYMFGLAHQRIKNRCKIF